VAGDDRRSRMRLLGVVHMQPHAFAGPSDASRIGSQGALRSREASTSALVWADGQGTMTTKIRKTFFYLLLIQGGSYIVPLLFLPYLGRVLGVTEFGVLAFCQAVTQYFILVTDYGYNVTATRLISMHRDDSQALWQVYSSTTAARLVLVVISLVSALIAVASIPVLTKHWTILAAAFIGVVGTALTPVWLFQGLERMRSMVIPVLISRLLSLVFVVATVRGEGDAALAALGISAGQISLAFMMGWIVHRDKLVRLIAIPFSAVRQTLTDGFPVFLSLALLGCYSTVNTIVLNHLHGPNVVAQFAMADKIRMAASTVFVLMGQAFYPRISQVYVKDRLAAQRLMRTATLAVVGISLVLCVAIQVLAGWGIDVWLGNKFHDAIFLLRSAAILLPITAIGFAFSDLGLLVHGRTRTIKNIYLGSTLLHILYLVPLTSRFGAEGTMVALILTELCNTVAFVVAYYREIKTPSAAKACVLPVPIQDD
jgi:PST family polysaccharide transporter